MEFNTDSISDFLIDPKRQVYLTTWSPPMQELPGTIQAYNHLGILFQMEQHAPQKEAHTTRIFLPWHSILWIR